ncbi:RPL6B [Brettanomyces bruxellensis]|uniref:DEBR0S3_13124g1_1 n=1 Tax=Dekkera bruxellensis TaxID=5007 RepID=A0A7D9H074_DEKBR|nr:RPL6B [Brettanomyces bruxellensis]
MTAPVPKWYKSHDAPVAKKTRKAVRPQKLRKSLVPGTVLILLAGRFRGKRVVYLKPLEDSTLLVSGPFKVNGVPLRRVNSRYVIATSTRVSLEGLDLAKFMSLTLPERRSHLPRSPRLISSTKQVPRRLLRLRESRTRRLSTSS